MNREEWNRRYAGSELVWSAGPNQFLADEVASWPPGRALDVACGEGRNALWLAEQGWEVTAIDFAAAALEKGRALAERRGLSVRFVETDVLETPYPGAPYDLVILFYVQLPALERRRVVRAGAEALAPGGALLVVGHDTTNLEHGVGGPQDPEVLFTPDDVLADLADMADLAPLRVERRTRRVATDEGPRDAIDAFVFLRRASEG
ncbi:MAG: class I SAM-dependent methyltransferase [Actinomycetota bacterium]|nr:class I SAM-dependent methyltransferase [Actinomycetota bacterium]